MKAEGTHAIHQAPAQRIRCAPRITQARGWSRTRARRQLQAPPRQSCRAKELHAVPTIRWPLPAHARVRRLRVAGPSLPQATRPQADRYAGAVPARPRFQPQRCSRAGTHLWHGRTSGGRQDRVTARVPVQSGNALRARRARRGAMRLLRPRNASHHRGSQLHSRGAGRQRDSQRRCPYSPRARYSGI